MMIRRLGFNLILLSAALVVSGGCSSTGDAKKFSVLRVHLETNKDSSDKTKPVPIYRDHPFNVVVERSPFVTEANVSGARVLDTIGGYALEVKFERRGAWLLEQYSTGSKGKRFAIYSEFLDPMNKKQAISRWLAAPMINGRITDGTLTFTPDATREECENIAKGLNRLAKKLDGSYSW